jgi:anti-sigma regulatory factor (Ser/Thr protein kinase)
MGVAEELRGDVSLVLSELLTNSYMHSLGAGATVLVELVGDELHLCVEDRGESSTGNKAPELQDSPPYAEAGRGLHIVDALATSWRWRWHDADWGLLVFATFELDT